MNIIFIAKFWKEAVIAILVVLCGLTNLSLQKAKSNLAKYALIHENYVEQAKSKELEITATYNKQRQIDAQEYANEIIKITDSYNAAVNNSNRVYKEVAAYNADLHSTTREAVENYAKTSSVLFGECKAKYLELGYYTAKVNAELDKNTKPQ